MTSNYFNKIDSLAVAGWAEYQGNENLFGLWLSAAEVSFSKAEAYLMGYGVAANADLAKATSSQVSSNLANTTGIKKKVHHWLRKATTATTVTASWFAQVQQTLQPMLKRFGNRHRKLFAHSFG